ncbi:uncharacterized protein C5L36_0B00780 [Pichia kudriavzevii]|uniref:Uncharacterized protein n=2 Tax=Pichia kudriavzevii TaxID=4909 RepID=A0A2U9R0I3_PICKU|nr:uncharacterized protein C5L36_0B00780 [Pichia kudriavzevii]AWU74811.1 hypothetical protein C5L36_0B00780 [Pichia kudriavzevii]
MWILYLLRIFDCYLQLFLRMWFLKKTRKDLSTMNRIKGSLLEYAFKKHAFEYGDLNSENVLIFVGGLTDKLATVPYVPFLSGELNKMGWSVVQIEFTSSHIGWGTGSLARDHSEIAELVRFLKSKQGGARKKIGIMGHSTGCQNTIYYFCKAERNKDYDELDFGIIQASVSDSEAVSMFGNEATKLVEEGLVLAKEHLERGQPKELMPYKYSQLFFDTPLNAYRFYSLYSKRGDDDFFSSYLSDQELKSIFGKIDKPLLCLYSGADEFVPEKIDKELLLKRFSEATPNGLWSKNSKVISGALHNLGDGSRDGAVAELGRAVVGFLTEEVGC